MMKITAPQVGFLMTQNAPQAGFVQQNAPQARHFYGI